MVFDYFANSKAHDQFTVGSWLEKLKTIFLFPEYRICQIISKTSCDYD